MARREETPLDQETYERVLAEELGKGTDRRVAEGRARAAGVRAYRAAHGGGEAATPPAAAAAPAPAPAAAAAPAPAAAAAPAPAAAQVAAAVTPSPVREAPLPTGNVPEPKRGAPEKHRLLALVPPEGIQRVEREQGDRINVWPHLLIEEFISLLF